MNHVSHRMRSQRPPIGLYLLMGITALGAGVILIRSMPDLIRYLRLRRM